MRFLGLIEMLNSWVFFCSLFCLMGTFAAYGNVILIADNITSSFEDIEANFGGFNLIYPFFLYLILFVMDLESGVMQVVVLFNLYYGLFELIQLFFVLLKQLNVSWFWFSFSYLVCWVSQSPGSVCLICCFTIFKPFLKYVWWKDWSFMCWPRNLRRKYALLCALSCLNLPTSCGDVVQVDWFIWISSILGKCLKSSGSYWLFVFVRSLDWLTSASLIYISLFQLHQLKGLGYVGQYMWQNLWMHALHWLIKLFR